MLKNRHVVDTNFLYVSAFLKKTLNEYKDLGGRCLDLPCGTGRNLFLLANKFEYVAGIDIESSYLESVKSVAGNYDHQTLELIQLDFLYYPVPNLCSFNLISVIHYFNFKFLQDLISGMSIGSLLLLETPTCSGGNFRELPTIQEIKNIIAATQLLVFEFNQCKKEDNLEKRGSVKLLLKK